MKALITSLFLIVFVQFIYSQSLIVNKTDGNKVTFPLSEIEKITFMTLPVNGLVAYYPFNGNANDESGNGNNGTLKGGVTLATDRKGVSNRAYNFNGSTGYIEISNSASLQTPAEEGTITGWVYINGENLPYNHVTIASKSTGSGYGQYHFMYHTYTGPNLHLQTTHSSGTCGNAVTLQQLNYQNWYFVATTWDKTSIKFYLNNNLIGQGASCKATPDNNRGYSQSTLKVFSSLACRQPPAASHQPPVSSLSITFLSQTAP